MNMMIEIPEELQTHVSARTPDWGLCKCNRLCIGSGNARSRSAVASGKISRDVARGIGFGGWGDDARVLEGFTIVNQN